MSIVSKAAREVTGQLIEPLTKPGARISPRSKTVKEIEPPAVDTMPLGPRIDAVPEPEVTPPPQPVAPEPVTEAEVDARITATQAETGTAREVPSPSRAQKEAGIAEGPVNTTFYDSDTLAATVQAAAKVADQEGVAAAKPMTVQQIYDRAMDAGIPEENLNAIFGSTEKTTAVGGSQLAEYMAGLMVLHDVSAGKVDELMRLAGRGELDDAGKLELREAIAQHDVILAELSGAKTDVARAMNVFKNTKDRGSDLSINEVRAALDALGGDEQLRYLAEAYNSTNSVAARNALLRNGVRRKSYESMVYMAQSVMLNDPVTHFYNAAGNGLMQFLDVPERMFAVAMSPLRQRLEALFGKASPDQYYATDIYARLSGLRNGIIDGFTMMGRKFKGGGAAKDAPRDPLRAEYWAGAPYKIPFTKKIREFPDLTASPLGKAFNMMGLVYSVPFRALGAADEFFAGISQRVQLHEEAARLGGRVFDETFADLIAKGAEEKTAHIQAVEAGQRAVQKLLTERPDEVEASIQAWRKQSTLQDDLDKELPMAGIYGGANKLMNQWYLKPLAPFSKTLTNIANEGMSRMGPAALLSPRFWSDWQKGGRHRDLAISKMALGGAMLYAGYDLAGRGRITGAGPSDTGQRNDLKARGWQEFGLRIGKDEITAENVKRLNDLIPGGIVEGTGEDFGDSYYIPLNRLEPANMPFLIGAAIADATKYKEYDPDNTMFDIAFSAGMAGVSEFATSIPTMQTFSELMSIAGHKQTDGGDRLVAILNAIQKRYTSFYVSATPGIGMSNSTLVARIERAIDPTISNVGVGEDYPDSLVGFGEAMRRWRSRIPIYSRDVLPKLNDWGDEIGTNQATAWQPLAMTYGETDEVLEFLDAIQHNMPQAPRAFEGIKLPPEVENRFKELYGKEITIDGMDLKENIKVTMSEMMDDFEMSGEEFPIGQARAIVNNIVGQYRKLARLRMFGALEEDPLVEGAYEYSLVPEDMSSYGLDDDKIEFPAFAEKLAAAKNKKKFPRLSAPPEASLQSLVK